MKRVEGGVYAIRNKVTQEEYIGSSKNIRERVQTHFRDLAKGSHRNWRLQAAFNKYGRQCFYVSVVEYIEDGAKRVATENLYISCGAYNLAPTASWYATSDEARRRMSERNWIRGKKQDRAFVEKRIAPLRGRTMSPAERAKLKAAFTPEVRARMRAAHIGKPSPRGMLGKRHSSETIGKMRAAALRREAAKRQTKET